MDVFPIIPASAKPLWFIAAIALVLGLVLVLLAYVAWSARHSRVEIGSESIRLVGDFWGRSIPLRSLDLEHARSFRLASAPEFQPVRRTLGTGLGGYAAGWFKLRSGEKALVYLTSWESVVRIPTSEGYSLLLSVAEPEALLQALRARQAE